MVFNKKWSGKLKNSNNNNHHHHILREVLNYQTLTTSVHHSVVSDEHY